MITFTYLDKPTKLYSDYKIEEFLLSLDYTKDKTITISQISIIYTLRKLVAEKKIDSNTISIFYNNYHYTVDSTGRFKEYPMHNDLFDQALDAILSCSR